MARYTKIPTDTFKHLVINAGVLLKEFTPSTGAWEPKDQIGATTGGMTFTTNPAFTDYGSDVDNCPKNIQYSYQPRENVVASTQNWAFYS